jgi:hypothetical protein
MVLWAGVGLKREECVQKILNRHRPNEMLVHFFRKLEKSVISTRYAR